MKDLSWPARRTHDRFCCDGLCNGNQGRGGYPRYAQPESERPKPALKPKRPKPVREPLSCRLRFIVGLLFAGFIWVVTR